MARKKERESESGKQSVMFLLLWRGFLLRSLKEKKQTKKPTHNLAIAASLCEPEPSHSSALAANEGYWPSSVAKWARIDGALFLSFFNSALGAAF